MSQTSGPVVVLDPRASNGEREEALAAAGALHPGAAMARGDTWAAIAIGDGVGPIEVESFRNLASVERIVDVSAPYRLASREVFAQDTSVVVRRSSDVPGPAIGGGEPIVVMASCAAAAMDGERRLATLAGPVREAGAMLLFAGEITTGVDHLPGITLQAMAGIRSIAEDAGMALCVEVSDARQIAEVAEVADLLQVGSRNMQDFNLLRELGRADRPVLLKRGPAATVEEFLLAAEYVLSHGNGRVILCESGIRTFDPLGKPRFEINAIPVIKGATHLPLMADPSQATPHARLVPAVARAAIAAGADGLVLEVAELDGQEETEATIGLNTLRRLLADLDLIAHAVGRRM